MRCKAAEKLAERGHRGRGDRPAHPAPARHRDGRRIGEEDQPHRHASRRAGRSPASASEIAAVMMEQAFDWLDAPVMRVAGKDVPLPYAANLESWRCRRPRRSSAAARKSATALGGARAMPIKILMPALSPTMTEGKLAKWLKKEGDDGQVRRRHRRDRDRQGDDGGRGGRRRQLGKILVPEGTEGVKVNEPIAVLLEEGEDRRRLQRRRRKPAAAPAAQAAGGARRETGARCRSSPGAGLGTSSRSAPAPAQPPPRPSGHPASASSPARWRGAWPRTGGSTRRAQRLRPARPHRQGRYRGGARPAVPRPSRRRRAGTAGGGARRGAGRRTGPSAAAVAGNTPYHAHARTPTMRKVDRAAA